MLKNFKLNIEYDGTNLHGWQVQPNQRTVQGDIENALASICPGNTVSLIGSGRTDSGVHALDQVANVKIDTRLMASDIRNALNAKLKKDIRITACELVNDTFNARYTAIERLYAYKVVRRYSVFTRQSAWWVRYPLNEELLQQCAEIVKGTHDFTIFCKATAEVDNKICHVLESKWTNTSDMLSYTIKANRFLQHMVRYLVGTMIEVGRGRYALPDFLDMINNHKTEITVVRAPAQGLALTKVIYPLTENQE